MTKSVILPAFLSHSEMNRIKGRAPRDPGGRDRGDFMEENCRVDGSAHSRSHWEALIIHTFSMCLLS